ncbi:protein CROWDED NUCLEI 1-like [Camellia sinensis]|uniref:protein CROWDED NUCLEI 1-like n=1 Tax=Camellia sinensis TaxID=4442 RepID=UPI00103678DF|nr:protein CROWDED NUCLEI 1-like [Camellia sinensis]
MMFTPQRKVWSGWSLTPRTDPVQKNGYVSGSDPVLNPRNVETVVKGRKTVAFVESTTPPPPLGSLGENGGTKVAIVEKLSKLENELFEYQYNMGLLLIEKKEWTSKYEETVQALAEAKDALKREHVSHLIAMSEIEQQEENLRKALGVEKQCVLDLEKTLREMRSEYAEIKFTSDLKLAEANGLITSIEEKSLEVETKFNASDAKLAEVSRKSSEIKRKSHEVAIREDALRRECISFNAEQEARESTLSKQREDLREWERKLQDGEERLAEVRRLLNQREEKANEHDTLFKQRQNDLEEAQKKIFMAKSTLKKKEDDISRRVAELSVKEKEADAMRNSLEMKDKELLALEEKLDARARVEIQKLLDEHKTILDTKKHELELDMEQQRKAFHEDLKSKEIEVENKEAVLNHMEEKVAKHEQAYAKKMEKFIEKEKDVEAKLKDLKEREKSIKVDEKKLKNERKLILLDKEKLLNLNDELEKTRAEIEEQQLKINQEMECLEVTKEERTEYVRLQSELKQEIDNCRQQREQLMKDSEELKQEREKFEKEWEELDGKRAESKKELEDVTKQKEKLAKLERSEEERLENEKLATRDYVQRELEALNLAKASFAASMEYENSLMAEKTQSETARMLHDFEVRKRELETEMQNRREEMENHLHQREKLFEEEREKELNNINYLREVARREMEEMKLERPRIEKEEKEIAENQKQLVGQQHEMQKDIDELVNLSKKLKDQREQFMKERERFNAFVEKFRSCNACGKITCEFMASDLQSSPEMDNAEELPLPRLADDYLKEAVRGNVVTFERQNSGISRGVIQSALPASGGNISWLWKCTSKLFNLSPVEKNEIDGPHNLTENPMFGKHISVEEPQIRLLSTEDGPESFGVATDSFDVQRIQSYNSIGEVSFGQDQSVDDQSDMNSRIQEIPEDLQNSDLKGVHQKPGRRDKRVNRTCSVKVVFSEAKSILGDAFEHKGNAEDSAKMNEEGHGESSIMDRQKPRNARKRAHSSLNTVSEQDGNHSEGRSDSVSASRRKRRQKAAQAVQIPSEVQHNLRRRKT